MRIVLTGLIGSIPMAGLTLHYLQYLLGLRALGHDVLYLEDTGADYYDQSADAMTTDVAPAVSYLSDIMDQYGCGDVWSFVGLDDRRFGVAGLRFAEFVESADAFINVTGAGLLRDDYMGIPRRAYVDTDPAFVQIRAASGAEPDIAHLDAHTHHFTFGVNIGGDDCSIPTCGYEWRPTFQPIDFGLWPESIQPPEGAPFTTVMKWKTYDPVIFQGRRYGLKESEMAKFAALPSRCPARVEIALAGEIPELLADNGWVTRPATDVSQTVAQYRDYILSSAGEWSVAKEAYVATNSGWFSERSACYMACSRPVVVQETGFSNWLKSDAGVLSFSTLDEACAALERVRSSPVTQGKAALDLAHEYFSATRVLARLLSELET